jgi:hypothetical protein
VRRVVEGLEVGLTDDQRAHIVADRYEHLPCVRD